MKKTLILLSLIIPALAFVACQDDNDLPKVKLEVDFGEATVVDNTVYVVQGESFEVTGIKVINEESDKNAGITQASYYWDYYYLGTAVQPPYGFEVQLDDNTPVGRHLLEIESPLFAVDKAPAFAVMAFDIEVVASADDLPSTDQPAVVKISPSVKDKGK